MMRFAFLCIALFCSPGIAGDPLPVVPVLVEGDPIAGVGTVQTIDNLAINNFGEWLVEANTDFANSDEDTVLLKNGSVFLREGFGGLDAPAGAIIDSFDSVTLNNHGDGGLGRFYCRGLCNS